MRDIIETIAVLFLLFVAFKSGEKSKEREIKDRAQEINKECYTNQDIEKIIFNESQL